MKDGMQEEDVHSECFKNEAIQGELDEEGGWLGFPGGGHGVPSPAPCALVAVQTKQKIKHPQKLFIIIYIFYIYIFLYLPPSQRHVAESPQKVRAADHALFFISSWSTNLPQISFLLLLFCVYNVLNNLSQESAAAKDITET